MSRADMHERRVIFGSPDAGLTVGVQGSAQRSRLAKRWFDVISASLLLLFISPIFITVVLLVRLSDGGDIFYRHIRIGRNGKPFGCLKFRTMRSDGDLILRRHLSLSEEARHEWETDRKLRNDPRVTRLGKILRKTSLDELPQLINIIRGDMSVVGPRPVTRQELARYGKGLDHYLSVRPGLTGQWQVSGRNDVGYEQRVALDVDYVRHQSFSRDMLIIFKTVGVLFLQKGSY